MASLKFRNLTPNVTVEQHLVKADEKFFHEGSHFVVLNGSGLVRVCVENETSIYGWALVPQGKGDGSSSAYWQANSSGTSKIMVVVDEDARFLVPLDDTITRADIGNAMDFILPASSNGTIQKLDVGENNQNVVRLVGLGTSLKGGTTSDGIVKINTFQADT